MSAGAVDRTSERALRACFSWVVWAVMDPHWSTTSVGPYTSSDVAPGESYEISNGHKLECMSTGERGARNNAAGVLLLGTDPDARSVGVDVGISPHAKMLRAPDLVIGDLEDKPGWAQTVPPFAVEYADTGQDEPSLRQKIRDLLGAGTKLIWVVRQQEPRCVEVHAPEAPVRLARIGDMLEAPGILRNPVPVSALYDPNEAKRLALRNLLQREGYESLESVKEESRKTGFDEGRDEGQKEGRKEGQKEGFRSALSRMLTRRKFVLTAEQVARIEQCEDFETLNRWLDAAMDAKTVDEVFV